MTSKIEWRKAFIEKRKNLSSQRRKDASARLVEELKDLKGNILSFTPIGSEIDIAPLNKIFSREKRLYLVPYHFDTLIKVDLKKIDCILVPGLGFDQAKYRLGYGQGYYDRFLAETSSIPTIGIGYQEQYCAELLPRDLWDIPLQEVLLV